ncbi:MAG: lipocalin family protein [Robiginitalea sp.]|nr:lipocalin family protein [Robiginitalea sp.]
MKLRIFLSIVFGALLLSCSSDDDSGSNSIVGTWDLVAVELDGTTPEEEAAEQLISLLALQGCYLITLDFEESGTASFQSSLGYIDYSGLLAGSFNVDCPTESDTESATYTYENGQLEITDASGLTETVGVILSGDRLTFDLEGSEFEDIGSSGSLIFERR